jgi:hypothetical protein
MVTSMETAMRAFELDWSGHLLEKSNTLTDADRRPLFDLATGLESQLPKLQSDETDEWVVEFNSGRAALDDLLKTQRESADKAEAAVKAVIDARSAAESTRQRLELRRAIELSLTHQAVPTMVHLSIDGGTPEAFLGTQWSKLNMTPGYHEVTIWNRGGAGPNAILAPTFPRLGLPA